MIGAKFQSTRQPTDHPPIISKDLLIDIGAPSLFHRIEKACFPHARNKVNID